MNKIKVIEKYVQEILGTELAHDWKHVFRVRNNILKIAKAEKYSRLDLAEAAALLHDIGLPSTKKQSEHGAVGAVLAEKFLKEKKLFSEKEIAEITNAIRFHNKKDEGEGKLLHMLRDADVLDMLGTVGIMRGFMSRHFQPDYDPKKIKGAMWLAKNKAFDKRFKQGLLPSDFAVDQINFQRSCRDNLKTKIAKKLARPLIKVMENFILQLEKEIRG
jgi:putative nucleotidyltransferase with HDIG domain